MKILFIGSRLFDDIDFYIKEKNIESIVTESNENALNLDLADQCFIVPRGMEAPMEIAINQEVDAIIPLIGIDSPLMDVAIMKEQIESKHNIPVIASNKRVIELTNNKINTKSFFNNIGVNTPKFKVLNKNNIDEINDFNFPVVLKQGEGQGGKNIKIALNIEDVEDYFNKFDEALCEEFIDGYEISIEVLGYKNEYLALVPIYKGETSLDGLHPLKKMRLAPCNIKNLNNEYIKDISLKIANSLEFEGIIDIDFIFSKYDSKLYGIEINARPNGIRYVTDGSSGVNTILKLVDMASNEFNIEKIKKDLKSFYACEIPIGNYKGPKPNEPLKSFKNNDFIVHGPEGHERITIRANTKENLNKLIKDITDS